MENWIRAEDHANLPRLRAVVAEWLAEPIDWDEFDYFDAGGTPMGAAKAFFEELDQETLRALKIKIVDGDRPGSTCYAAELHMDLHETNTKAQAMDMPFRFRAAHVGMDTAVCAATLGQLSRPRAQGQRHAGLRLCREARDVPIPRLQRCSAPTSVAFVAIVEP
ncbi:MAG: hypothetical protein RL227_2440 [Pseudomonadota bacterium]